MLFIFHIRISKFQRDFYFFIDSLLHKLIFVSPCFILHFIHLHLILPCVFFVVQSAILELPRYFNVEVSFKPDEVANEGEVVGS